MGEEERSGATGTCGTLSLKGSRFDAEHGGKIKIAKPNVETLAAVLPIV